MDDGFRFQVILTEGYSSQSMFQFRWENHIFWVRPTFWSVDHGERKNGGGRSKHASVTFVPPWRVYYVGSVLIGKGLFTWVLRMVHKVIY